MLALKSWRGFRRPVCTTHCYLKNKRYVQVTVVIESLETTIKRVGNLSSNIYFGMDDECCYTPDEEDNVSPQVAMLGCILILYIVLMFLRREKHHCDTTV